MAEVLVLGSAGMLGWMMVDHLSQDHKILGLDRTRFEVSHNWDAMKWSLNYELLSFGNVDYIINCIGAIKPSFNDPSRNSINNMVNAVFPWLLADYAKDKGCRLIHVTTDCVYDGKDGFYTENSPHNPLDAYGKSKSLGEPNNCMVLRTSIIGPEKNTNKSLMAWLMSKAGGQADGFTNHIWNGLTTLELARAVNTIIHEDLYYDDTFHVFSNDISKYDMLRMMNEAYSLEIEITPKEAPAPCNRTLRTVKSLNSIIGPATFKDMIEELRYYVNNTW
jgi:dTDP-4-dehydrorhamnose reductase